MNDRLLNKKMRFLCIKKSILYLLLVFLSSCAQFSQVLTKPNVSLESITLANNDFLSPRFNVSLRVSNPNSIALPVVGMTYAIKIEGVELFNGVKDDVPVMAAYRDTIINLELGTSILKAVNLICLVYYRVLMLENLVFLNCHVNWP